MRYREDRSRDDLIFQMEKEGRLDPICSGCKEFYDSDDPSSVFAPDHRPSPRCESGKRPHCTCDT